MIRGTTAQFKFEMPKSFDNFCIIDVIFGQEGNVGTIEAPLPIKKTYNRGYIKVQTWNSTNKNPSNIYYDGISYYKFENNTWVSYDIIDINVTNDGIQLDPSNPNVLLTSLAPSETMRFSDKRKGFVQIFGYCDTDGVVIGSFDEKFMIYPARTNDINDTLLTVPDDAVVVLDAGVIL